MTNLEGIADHAADTTVDTMLANEQADGNDNIRPIASADWTAWLKAAGIRTIKTGAQTLITLIGTDMVSIVQLDWIQMLAVTATTMVLSALTSIAGIPEVDEGKSPIPMR